MDSPPSQQTWGRSSTLSTTHLNRTTSSPSSPSFSKDSIQSLSSILNNPLSSTTVYPPEFSPISSTKATSEVTRSDFISYLTTVSDPFHRFDDIRKHATKEISGNDVDGAGAGEALVACLREVPSLYFKEDFRLEEGATFRAACPFSTFNENAVLQEKLSQYLDVVELHLVKEISLRSSSFFEAQGQLQDLNGKIVEGCARIRELKDTVQLIDSDLVESARQIQQLNGTRTNLLALQQKLRLILYVNQALSALKLVRFLILCEDSILVCEWSLVRFCISILSFGFERFWCDSFILEMSVLKFVDVNVRNLTK
jgi:vacuolar protein sorting-associated protein 54